MKDWYGSEIVLENERVKLVPFSDVHAEGLRRIIMDPELHAFAGIVVQGENDLQAYIVEALASRNACTHYPFIVIDQQTGEVAGSTRFGHVQFGAKRLEIGWTWYGRASRGTGLNRAVKFELLRYAFETLGFNRVQFSVDAENVRSLRAVLKLGAKQEGLFRCNYENARGECRDDVYFSIVKSEWPELRRTVFRGFG